MTDAKAEEIKQSEPFWLLVLDLFWLLFKRAIFAVAFLAVGYYYGYCDGWDDFRLELKQILQGRKPAPHSEYEETL